MISPGVPVLIGTLLQRHSKPAIGSKKVASIEFGWTNEHNRFKFPVN